MSKKSQERLKIEKLLAVVKGELEICFRKKDLIFTEEYSLTAQRDLLESLLNLKPKPAKKRPEPPVSNKAVSNCLPIEENIVKRQQPLDEWAAEKVAEAEKTVAEGKDNANN